MTLIHLKVNFDILLWVLIYGSCLCRNWKKKNSSCLTLRNLSRQNSKINSHKIKYQMNKEDMRFQPRSTWLQFESCMKSITMYVMCAQVMRCYRNRCSLLILVIVIKFVLLMITSGYKRKGEGNREKRTCPKWNSSYKKCWGELHIYKGH